MKRLSFFFAIFLYVSAFAQVDTLSNAYIIPKPVRIVSTYDFFYIKPCTRILINDSSKLSELANYLRSLLAPPTGFELPVRTVADRFHENAIFLWLKSMPELGSQGYLLKIKPRKIIIFANTPQGIFYGIQTLRQILPYNVESHQKQNITWKLPTGTILDYPTYAYRGAMLDVVRHYFPPEDIKKYIDLLALFKINYLHLHLTDDQGWRIQIPQFPKLTQISGHTEVGGDSAGFYTISQFQSIVKYAQKHFITIVPEIEMPGHCNAALAAYSELTCNDSIVKPYTKTGGGFSSLCTTKPFTYQFVDTVIKQVAEISPGPYFHIGGDESFATPHDQYVSFIDSVVRIVHKYHKIMIGWDEISAANISDSVVAQYWANAKNAKLAAQKGAKILFSPASYAYLDMKYNPNTPLGLHWAGYVNVQKAYNWSPDTLVKGLPKSQILGIEAPLWTETVKTLQDIEYMAFPRICGIAEIAWTPDSLRNWQSYRKRLAHFAPRFKLLKVNYYHSPLVPWVKTH